MFLLLSGVRLPRPVWAGVFAVALTLNVLALPGGVAVFEAAIRDEQVIPLEQRLAPYR